MKCPISKPDKNSTIDMPIELAPEKLSEAKIRGRNIDPKEFSSNMAARVVFFSAVTDTVTGVIGFHKGFHFFFLRAWFDKGLWDDALCRLFAGTTLKNNFKKQL